MTAKRRTFAVNTEKKQRGRPRGRPFKPGQSGNPAGRPKGSGNKLSEAFLSDFCQLWTEFGFDALRKMATRDPPGFASMAAALIPKQSEPSGPR